MEQQNLHVEDVPLLFLLGSTFTDVFAVSPDKVGWHQIGAGRETLADTVSRMRLDLDQLAQDTKSLVSTGLLAADNEASKLSEAVCGGQEGMGCVKIVENP